MKLYLKVFIEDFVNQTLTKFRREGSCSIGCFCHQPQYHSVYTITIQFHENITYPYEIRRLFLTEKLNPTKYKILAKNE